MQLAKPDIKRSVFGASELELGNRAGPAQIFYLEVKFEYHQSYNSSKYRRLNGC